MSSDNSSRTDQEAVQTALMFYLDEAVRLIEETAGMADALSRSLKRAGEEGSEGAGDEWSRIRRHARQALAVIEAAREIISSDRRVRQTTAATTDDLPGPDREPSPEMVEAADAARAAVTRATNDRQASIAAADESMAHASWAKRADLLSKIDSFLERRNRQPK